MAPLFRLVVMGTIDRGSHLFDYSKLFGSVPEQLPPNLPLAIAAAPGR